jgi:hypothetical protein
MNINTTKIDTTVKPFVIDCIEEEYFLNTKIKSFRRKVVEKDERERWNFGGKPRFLY